MHNTPVLLVERQASNTAVKLLLERLEIIQKKRRPADKYVDSSMLDSYVDGIHDGHAWALQDILQDIRDVLWFYDIELGMEKSQ